MTGRWWQFWAKLMPDHCRSCAIRAREIRRLKTQLAQWENTRTSGGPPPVYHLPGAWKGGAMPPPPSATDPAAPTLHRKIT